MIPHPGAIAAVRFADRIFAALVLFFGAWVLCLPVPYSNEVAQLYPWWAKRIDVGNVLLHELIFIAWVVSFGATRAARFFLRKETPSRQSALWLIVLALWCGIISLTSPMPGIDTGRTFRLLLNVGILIAVVQWARQYNNFPLIAIIAGFFFGTVINLVISFQYPLVVNGIMRLSGQNTPGVAMALAIHLCAWLFYRTVEVRAQILSFCMALVFAFSCVISFSRIGWFVGGLGLMAWWYIILLARPVERVRRRRLKYARVVAYALLMSSAVVLPSTERFQHMAQWVADLVYSKASYQGEGDQQRMAYLYGTMEILTKHPFGVGYSGFYDAMTATEVYEGPAAAVESSPSEANPHATFLWYAIAGGIPGFVMAIVVFVLLLNDIRWGLIAAMWWDGLFMFMLIAPGYLLMGLTVPYLFNSIVLIVPAAIAVGWGWSRKDRQSPVLCTNSQHSYVGTAGR